MRILFLRNLVLLDSQVPGKPPVPGRGGGGCPLVEEGAGLGQKRGREKGGKLPEVQPLPASWEVQSYGGPPVVRRSLWLEEVKGTGANLEPDLSSGGQVWLRLHTGLCEGLNA